MSEWIGIEWKPHVQQGGNLGQRQRQRSVEEEPFFGERGSVLRSGRKNHEFSGHHTINLPACLPASLQSTILYTILAFQKSGKRQSQGALFYRTLGRYIYMCVVEVQSICGPENHLKSKKNMASYLGAERTQRRGGNINYMSEPGVLLQGTIYLPPYASRKEHTLMQIHPHQCYFLWF